MSQTPSIARDLFLLCTNGKGRDDGERKRAVTAGALTDLLLAERIALSEDKDPRVTIVEDSPTGDVVLDHVLTGLRSRSERKPPKLSQLVDHKDVDPTEVIGEDLAAAGAVERKDGWFGTTWPERDGRFETALRRHLANVLEGREEPIPQDAVILGLLKALDAAHATLKEDVPDMSRKELAARIDDITEKTPITEAVRRSYELMQSAMYTAIFVPTIMMTTN
ncbi:MAG: GPP34 family phosphoprotein [Brachybacterium sp.]|nr:GPP34 family phosphoprotein [Brachybacterium sp.]